MKDRQCFLGWVYWISALFAMVMFWVSVYHHEEWQKTGFWVLALNVCIARARVEEFKLSIAALEKKVGIE
jgi:hypothetical protein